MWRRAAILTATKGGFFQQSLYSTKVHPLAIRVRATYQNDAKNIPSQTKRTSSVFKMAEENKSNREEYVQAEMLSETGNNEAYDTLRKQLKEAQEHWKLVSSLSSSNVCLMKEQDFLSLTKAFHQVATKELAIGRLDKAKSYYEELLSRQLKFYAKVDSSVSQEDDADADDDVTIRESKPNKTHTTIPKHLNIAQTLNSIGSIYSRLEDPIEAKKWFEAALNMKKELLLQKQGCEHHYEIGKTLNDMALNEMIMQNVDEEYDIDAIHIISMLNEAELHYQCHAEENEGSEDMSEHPDAAAIAENMAGVYRSFEDLDMALQKYQTALAILEKHKVYDTKKYEQKIVNLYVHIADCFNGLDMYDEAREQYEKALDLHLDIISPSSVVEETSLEAVLRHNIGNMYAKVGMLKEAQQYYERALKMKHKMVGDSHPEYALTLNAMGALLANQGDWQGSWTRFNEAKYIYEMHADSDIEIQERLEQTIKNIELLQQQRR